MEEFILSKNLFQVSHQLHRFLESIYLFWTILWGCYHHSINIIESFGKFIFLIYAYQLKYDNDVKITLQRPPSLKSKHLDKPLDFHCVCINIGQYLMPTTTTYIPNQIQGHICHNKAYANYHFSQGLVIVIFSMLFDLKLGVIWVYI